MGNKGIGNAAHPLIVPFAVPHDQSGNGMDSGQNYDATQENFAAGKGKSKK